jgi:flagellar hook assembly protein FlgD
VPVRRAAMNQNYPNPFNPVTRIVYWEPDGGKQRVDLVIYDVSGARVRTLVSGTVATGRHEVTWDGRNDQGQAVGSGVYFYKMIQENFKATRKMLLLK